MHLRRQDAPWWRVACRTGFHSGVVTGPPPARQPHKTLSFGRTSGYQRTGHVLSATAASTRKHPFSRMRSEGSRFTWGSGGEAVFAKFCVCGRNRPQPFATVRNRSQVSATACVSAVRLSTVASVSGAVPKACQVESLSLQLYWCPQRRCL